MNTIYEGPALFVLMVFLLSALTAKTVYTRRSMMKEITTATGEKGWSLKNQFLLLQLIGTLAILLIFGVPPRLLIAILCIDAVGQYLDFINILHGPKYATKFVRPVSMAILYSVITISVCAANGVYLIS